MSEPSSSLSPRLWPPLLHQVRGPDIRKYASAVGEVNPVHFDREAALRAGFRDLVAPPMFAAVYAGQAVISATKDPALSLADRLVVHAEQQFEWEEPVCAGDAIQTTTRLEETRQTQPGTLYLIITESSNQLSQVTARGRWGLLVR